MISDIQALQIAENHLKQLNQISPFELALVNHKHSKINGGWKFSYNSQEYVDGKDDPIMGYLKFAVSNNGKVFETGDGSELGTLLESESKTPFF